MVEGKLTLCCLVLSLSQLNLLFPLGFFYLERAMENVTSANALSSLSPSTLDLHCTVLDGQSQGRISLASGPSPPDAHGVIRARPNQRRSATTDAACLLVISLEPDAFGRVGQCWFLLSHGEWR